MAHSLSFSLANFSIHQNERWMEWKWTTERKEKKRKRIRLNFSTVLYIYTRFSEKKKSNPHRKRSSCSAFTTIYCRRRRRICNCYSATAAAIMFGRFSVRRFHCSALGFDFEAAAAAVGDIGVGIGSNVILVWFSGILARLSPLLSLNSQMCACACILFGIFYVSSTKERPPQKTNPTFNICCALSLSCSRILFQSPCTVYIKCDVLYFSTRIHEQKVSLLLISSKAFSLSSSSSSSFPFCVGSLACAHGWMGRWIDG